MFPDSHLPVRLHLKHHQKQLLLKYISSVYCFYLSLLQAPSLYQFSSSSGNLGGHLHQPPAWIPLQLLKKEIKKEMKNKGYAKIGGGGRTKKVHYGRCASGV